MTLKNTKTILFASLITAMILSFSGMTNVYAEEAQQNNSYVKKIQNTQAYKDLKSDDREKFDQNLKESLENASPYQKKVNKLLDKLASNESEIEASVANGDNITKLEKKQSAIIFDLEKYGVVTQERLLENPNYWAERAYEAQVQISKGKEVSVILENKTDPTLYNIHTDDVSLKVQSQMSYVCATYTIFDIPIYCMNIGVEWGGEATANATQWLSYSGQLYTLAKICLEDDGGHNQVFFSFDTDHNTETIWGTTVWQVIHPTSNNYLTYEGICAQWEEDTNAIAGLWAETKTHLDTTVTVSNP